jgi:CRISPR/Cas system-associated endonuclease Cas3-HD
MIRTRKQLKTKKKNIEKTKQVLKIREKLQKSIKNANQREINNEIRKEKAFEPVVKTLRDIENAANKTDADSQKALIPVKTLTLIEQPIYREKKPKMVSSFQTPTRDFEYQLT